MSWSSCGRLVRSVAVLRRLSRSCRLGQGLWRLRRARMASGHSVISGVVMHTGARRAQFFLYLAGARVSADVRWVRELLDRNNASLFILRPDVRGALLPDVLEDLTLRQFVQLAMRRDIVRSSTRGAWLVWGRFCGFSKTGRCGRPSSLRRREPFSVPAFGWLTASSRSCSLAVGPLAGRQFRAFVRFRPQRKAAGHPANVGEMGAEACATLPPCGGYVGFRVA